MNGIEYLLGALGISALRRDTGIESALLHLAQAISDARKILVVLDGMNGSEMVLDGMNGSVLLYKPEHITAFASGISLLLRSTVLLDMLVHVYYPSTQRVKQEVGVELEDSLG